MVDLERERVERQRRIEDSATAVYMALERRAAAEALVASAEKEIATALRAILDEGTDADRTAALCGLSVSDVRRLTRRRANGQLPGEPASGV